jgi:hypothetical protein
MSVRGAHQKWAFGVAVLASTPAFASGGEHVIDDASVETPGTCHLESWVSLHGHGRGLLNLSPACTPKVWPRLELGAALQHSSDGGSLTTFGPAFKLNLRPLESGVGFALVASTALRVRSGKLEAASLIMPVSVPISEGMTFNLSGGWTYLRGRSRRQAAFYGAQIETRVRGDWSLMAEVFRRGHDPSGAQTGVRWTPHGGHIDFDLVVGHRTDGVNTHSISFGLTLRS